MNIPPTGTSFPSAHVIPGECSIPGSATNASNNADGGDDRLLHELRRSVLSNARGLIGGIVVPSAVETFYAEISNTDMLKQPLHQQPNVSQWRQQQEAQCARLQDHQNLSVMLEPIPIKSSQQPSSFRHSAGADTLEPVSRPSGLLQMLQKPADEFQIGQVGASTNNEQFLTRAFPSSVHGVLGHQDNVNGSGMMMNASVRMASDGFQSFFMKGNKSTNGNGFPNMPLNMPTPMTNAPRRVVTQDSAAPEDDGVTSEGDKAQQQLPALRFRPFHEEKWSQRLAELRQFRKVHGHSLVPHTYPPNQQLARWVKRQRRQYKLQQEGKFSTMTAERISLLEESGFVWDSHEATWREKIAELKQYRARHGDTLVPSSYKASPSLAVWVKCQRRQYKLYIEGRPSSMTKQRIQELEGEGFCWDVRAGPRTLPHRTGLEPITVASRSA